MFQPQRIEQLVTDKQAEEKGFLKGLSRRRITPVVVPHDDPDHNPRREEASTS
jgi:hypothetical protein